MDVLFIIGIGVVIVVGVAGSLAALGWWKLADRWIEDEQHKRFKPTDKPGPEEVVIGGDQGRAVHKTDAD